MRNRYPRSLLFNLNYVLLIPSSLASMLYCRNVVAHVRNRYPRSVLFAAGWSLGANIMTRYLGKGLC